LDQTEREMVMVISGLSMLMLGRFNLIYGITLLDYIFYFAFGWIMACCLFEIFVLKGPKKEKDESETWKVGEVKQ